MTAEQLARLAELAASAAGYFARADPSSARRFADAAVAAVKLGADQLGVDLADNPGTSRLGRDMTDSTVRLGTGPEVA